MWNRSKLTSVSAILSVVAILVVGLFIVTSNERSFRQQKGDEVAAQAKILAATVTAALVFDDRTAAQEYIDALKENLEVRAAAVYDGRGMLFASYSRGAEVTIPNKVPDRATSLERDRVSVVVPVFQDRTPLGDVYVETILEPFGVRLLHYGTVVLLAVMAAVVVSVLGLANANVAKANAQLESKAAELSEANRNLSTQIEQREKAEEAFRQSQKMEAVGQLTGGIAHDFNNLLSVVLGNLDLLREKLTDASNLRLISNAMMAVNRGTKLTGKLLAFSRMQRLDLGPVDLRELLSGMGDLLERSLGPAIRLDIEFQPGSCVATADANQLELAIVNLAVNARDAMPDGGRLSIRVEEVDFGAAVSDLGPGRYWRIAVADTGVGMSLETRQRAFEPFYTTKGVGKGTGLGLSQVYGIARQSGGTAIIDSVPDQGTTVSILLPRTEGKLQPEAFVVAPMASVERVKHSGEETLLVVDDDVDVRRFLVASVTAMGYRTIEAANGHEALEALDGGLRPDLMILDFAMPGMNGAEVAAEALRRMPGIRILIATGYADTKALQGAIGALPMLRKPFLVADLAKAIEGELGRASTS